MEVLTIQLDPHVDRRLERIEQMLLSLTQTQVGAGANDSNEWLQSAAFQRKNRMGHTTLKKKVAEGKIEVSDGFGEYPRYRWADLSVR